MKSINLINKYKYIPVAVKVSIWFAVCSIIQKAIQFITIPLFTRLLSTQEYGQFTIYQSWFSLFSIFATLNLSYGVFNNGMMKYENHQKEYISSMQGLSIVATTITFVLSILLIGVIRRFVTMSIAEMTIMFLQILFTPPLLFWSTQQRFMYKYKALVIVTLTVAVLNPIVGLIMVIGAQDKGFARIFSSAIVGIVVGAFFMVYNFVKGRVFFQKQYWRFALKFNLPLIPHYLSMIVLGQADRIMIGQYYGQSQIAIYGLAYSLSLVMNIITQSINSSFVPWTYRQCKQGKYKDIGKVSDILLFVIGVCCLLPSVFAPELMAILGPAEYAEGAYLVAPISMSVFFTFLYGLFGNIEFYFEKSKFVMIASVSGAVLNIILNSIFIPMFGYQAAAYTTLICYIAFSIAHYIFMKKTCREQGITEPIYNIKRIIIISIVLFIVSHGVMFSYEFPLLRIGIIGIICAIVWMNRNKFIVELKQLKAKDNVSK